MRSADHVKVSKGRDGESTRKGNDDAGECPRRRERSTAIDADLRARELGVGYDKTHHHRRLGRDLSGGQDTNGSLSRFLAWLSNGFLEVVGAIMGIRAPRLGRRDGRQWSRSRSWERFNHLLSRCPRGACRRMGRRRQGRRAAGLDVGRQGTLGIKPHADDARDGGVSCL